MLDAADPLGHDGTMQIQQSPFAAYAIPAIVLAVVLAVRWKRLGRPQPLKLERLWIMPAIFAALMAFTFVEMPPHGWGWAFCLMALALGGVLGWQRGRMMRIDVDPATHALSQASSPAALIFVVALVLLRRAATAGGAYWLHLDTIAVTDMLMAFALGLIAVQRLEMFLRARRLLAASRATPR